MSTFNSADIAAFNGGVWVFCEQRQGTMMPTSFELISEGRKLADELGTKLYGILLGHNIEGIAKELGGYGADGVYVCDHPLLENYTTDGYTKVICDTVMEYKPEVMLIGATNIGRDLGPRCAARLHTGLCADCTHLDIDVPKYKQFLRESSTLAPAMIDGIPEEDRNLKMTRPAFGGNVMATIVCRNYRPQMATVRPGVMELGEKDTSRTGEVVMVDAGLTEADMNVEILDVVKQTKKAVDITDAKILVSGGRGVGGPEGYNPLRELAAELGGEVSSSRIGVDSGWIEKDRQVGQTGKTVHPELYIACGISGAIQHQAGMEDSEFILAINTDKFCPMMQLADLGIVGDLKKIVPALTEAVKAYKAKKAAL